MKYFLYSTHNKSRTVGYVRYGSRILNFDIGKS